jgi:DNA-binding SARP family transcriptional activator
MTRSSTAHGAGVDFRILGTLEVVASGRRVRIPAGKQRVLLVSLLLEAPQVVTLDRLVEQLWDGEPPAGPRAAVHTYIKRLRRTLDRGRDGLSELVRTAPNGYLIEADSGSIDLRRFRDHLARARTARSRGNGAQEWSELLDGLAQWRGSALADVPSDALRHTVSPVLTEEWLYALDRRNELALRFGRHSELVPQLRGLTTTFPLREEFWRQLMAALYRSNRQADALAAYAQVSARLREELGVHPGEELQELHLRILRGEPLPMAG